MEESLSQQVSDNQDSCSVEFKEDKLLVHKIKNICRHQTKTN